VTSLVLEANRDDLAAFIDGLFRYADDGTFVSWRAFRDDTKDAPPVFIAGTAVTDDRTELVETAVLAATDAAQHPTPAVFCPPIATFTNAQRAREVDLANGLALSVECDDHAEQARDTLEHLLGPATIVVASGGVAGDGSAKLHLHWRLSEPTSVPEDHARLKRARALATSIVGGDATNKPTVHPIRWPGSWHRKGTPRLATIVAQDLDREIDLTSTLELLELAAPQRADVTGRQSAGDIGAATSSIIAQLLSGDAMHAPLVALAFRYLAGGMADAQCVLTLRGLMEAIPAAARGSDERWTGHYNDIWRSVRSAREKIAIEGATSPVDISGFTASLSLVDAPNVIVARKPDVVQEIPAELLTPPGILGEITRYGINSAVRPVPIFAVQSALALGSVVCGRRYATAADNYSSLYFLNVGKSGSGKEHGKRTIERILKAAGADRRLLGPSNYSSGNAVFSALLEKPQHIAIIDEFGHFLESASGERDTYKSDVLTKLMEAFGRLDGEMIMPQFSTMTRPKSSDRPNSISRPAITLLAMTTPSTFYATMHSKRILDGFLNRFLIVEHQGPRMPSVERTETEVPASVIRWVQQLLAPHGDMDLGTQVDTVGASRLVELSPSTAADAARFEREMLSLANSLDHDGLGDMPIRAHELALRVALVATMGEQPDRPVITADIYEWASSYVRFFLHQTIEAVRHRVADSQTERTRNQILAAIREAGERGVTHREINRGKAFIGLAKRERLEAIESLLAAELVAWSDVPTEHAGRPRRALVAIGEAESGADYESAVQSSPLELVS
jgi:hypothetical protein